jgi:hypothetical protein
MSKFKRFGILSKSLALACMVWSLSGFARSEEAQTESVTAEGVGKTEASAKKGVRPAKNLLCTPVSLMVFRNHEEIRRCGASGA